MYEGIAYFKLNKPLLNVPIGSQVHFVQSDEREFMSCEGIRLPIDYAENNPDCFIPVTIEQHEAFCKGSLMQFAKENGVEYLALKDALNHV